MNHIFFRKWDDPNCPDCVDVETETMDVNYTQNCNGLNLANTLQNISERNLTLNVLRFEYHLPQHNF